MEDLRLPSRFEPRTVLSGAVARVVACFDRERDARVVVKLAASPSDEDFLALRKEFRLLASLDHPSVARARDFGLALDGRAWFSMDEVVGPDLSTFAQTHALLETLSVLVDVAHALDYVHARGYVHGDVKPTNVRIAGQRAYLLDFGLAFSRGEEAEGIRGTPSYAAPEVLRGGRPDRRADLYSLGMTFYESITGVLPTKGRDLAGILRFHLEEDVPVASAVKAGVPGKLDRLLAHLLEKEPGARYPSARHLLEDLGREFGLVRGSSVDARPELLTPPFAGRGELLSKFTDALRAAVLGRGRMVLVSGPEGAGKTRLLSELRACAQSEGALVFEGRALEEDRTPYRPVLDVLSAMTRLTGSAGQGARAALARAARLAATQVEDLPISRLTDERSRLALFEDVLNAFESTRSGEVGERPMVVLFDDVHLADLATLGLLSYLSKAVETCRIVLVGTALTAAEHDEAETTVADSEASAVLGPLSELSAEPWPLPPLTEPEVASAAAGALGESELSPDFVRALQHESQGLPGALVRILEHYVEARVLSVAEGKLVIDEERRRKVTHPGAVSELLDARLAALPPTQRSLLRALSIAPTDLSFDLARRLASEAAHGGAPEIATDVLADDLAALTASGLLVAREKGGETFWEFGSSKTRELVAASLGEAERRELHDLAAAFFESRLPQRPDFISAAATHALKGGDPERGVRLGLAAASQAERLFAYDPAATFYSGVLDFLDILGGRDAEKSSVRERLGDVHFRAGNWRRALSAYHFLLKELGARDDAESRRRAALLTYKVGMIRLRRGDAAAARTLFDRAEIELAAVGTAEERARLLDASARARLDRADHDGAEEKALAAIALVGPDGPDDLKALLNGTLGAIAYQRGDWPAAEESLLVAVEQARRGARPELIRRGLSALATVYWKTGRWAESERLERECLAEAERSRDLWGITTASTNIAIHSCGSGDFRAARPHFERALEINRRLGSTNGQALAHLNLGECDEILGRWDEAETNYRLMLDLLGSDRSNKNVLEAKLALGNLIRKRGDLDRAEKLLAETLEAARNTGDRDLIAAVLYPVALVEKDREHLDDARRHLDDVLYEMQSSGTKDGLGRVLFSSAELALRQADFARAKEDAAHGAALAEELGDRYDLGRLKTVEARLTSKDNRYEETDRLFDDGIRILSEIEALYDLGRAYYEWGVRTEERAKATARLGTAARLFERIGARRELERTRGVLERISQRIAAEAGAVSSRHDEGIIGLYEVSRIVNSTRDLSGVLDEIVDLALKRMNAERGMILLADPVTSRMSIRVARNLRTGREEEAEAISRSVVDRVVSEGRSILAADARIDPRFVGRESILAHSIVSFLCVPLRVKERISGAIYIDHRAAARLFSEADRAFLEAFADLAAVAIENARLVEELLEARLRLSVENESLKANLMRGGGLDAIVGTSEAAKRIKATLPRAAAGNTTVLIRGESGTGKNLVARVLHSLSPRRAGPFIQFNCAALPDTLAESELFGHEKGSFTGADRRKPGRFELASGGTIFLDEIGKTTLSIQAKLLRVVEDKEFERVGGTVTLKTDAKILAATNLDLEVAIERGEFREDLFYRLNVVPIVLPPLRTRLEDLPTLVEHFVMKLSRDLGQDPRRLDPGVLTLFSRYPWPGNVRELEATLHRALVLTAGDVLTERDFSWILESPLLAAGGVSAGGRARLATAEAAAKPIDPEAFERILSTVERDLIERALSESGGKIREASRRLGLARNTLKAKMLKYGLRGQDEQAG